MPVKKKIGIEAFLELSSSVPIVDVRSPGEFKHGHIPGSYNIPLFTDEQRAEVGIKYNREGREKAIIKGLDLIGPSMSKKLSDALTLARNKKLLVHCWRGGMRSESMAWLFSLGGIEVEILDGGYKSYRNFVLAKLSEKRRIIVLGGLTGSGKTEILKYLASTGTRVIDLEGLANHKGSAFGALGQEVQPTTEYFSNLVFNELTKVSASEIVWVEDESLSIGTVFIPEQIYKQMQKAPLIAVLIDIKTRIPRLSAEYSTFPKTDLINSVQKIAKRLGGDNTSEAIMAIEANDFERAIEITLKYYDKAYMYGLEKNSGRKVYLTESLSGDVKENSEKVLETAMDIMWE